MQHVTTAKDVSQELQNYLNFTCNHCLKFCKSFENFSRLNFFVSFIVVACGINAEIFAKLFDFICNRDLTTALESINVTLCYCFGRDGPVQRHVRASTIIDREFEFYEFFSFLKFNEFYEFFFGW